MGAFPRSFPAAAFAVFLTAVCLCPAETEIDLSKPPTAEQSLDFLRQGPHESAGQIWAKLSEAYMPSRVGASGSSRNESFRAWLALWQWFSLLARNDKQEFARFLANYVGYAEKDGERVLYWRPPDQAFDKDVEPLQEAELAEIASLPRPRQQFLSRLIPGDFQWQQATLLDYLTSDLAESLTRQPEKYREILQTLSEGDFTPAVMQNLRRLHAHNPEKFSHFFSLALALAIVFDQLAPPDWPHHQVHRSSLPTDNQSLEDRMDFWVESQKNKRLFTDLTRLSADQLKFVVDALVPAEELRYAQERLRFTRTAFHQAYSSINYDHQRIKARQFDWPEAKPYTLAEIQKSGGICVDQAYFAMIAGKARGLPTLYFVGQGADGGHAWFGFLRNDTQWNLDAGRYENQNYAVGAALDPQIWERITDHELKFLSQGIRKNPQFLAGLADIAMAREFERRQEIQRALDASASAIANSPQNPDAWYLRLQLLLEKDAPFAEIRTHLENALKTFAKDADVRANFQSLLSELARDAGDEKFAAELRRRMITQNTSRRSDISVSAASARLAELLESGNTEEALKEFRAQVNRLGRTGGGNFFYDIVAPLVEHLLQNDNPREARRVLDQSRRALRPDPGSILDNELRELEQRTPNSSR